MRRQSAVVVALVTLLVATACEGVIRHHVDTVRQAAGVPVADTRTNLYLDTTAQARAAARCDGPLAVVPEIAYGGETAVAVAELTGVAPLDPAVADPDEREYWATELLWGQWMADPLLVDPDLTVGAVATVDCGDDTIAGVIVLREEPTMPADGRFVTDQYTNAELEQHLDLVYATVIDHTGQIIDLTLDIHAPPDDGSTARPAVLLFHGGGFTSGNKANRANDAKAYARRGFVGITASYRLRSRPVDLVPAANDGIDDGHEAVRWLKANANSYGVDPDRIAAAGTSAGGAIALGIAATDDPSPGGPLAAQDPTVAAALSTGGHLTPGLDDLTFDGDGSPALAFYYELDAQGWEHAYQTCTALHAAHRVCNFVLQPGDGHTTSLSPAGPWWSSEIGPFLWHHLELDGIEGPTAAEPFHLPTIADASTLDTVTVQDWRPEGDTRVKLLDIRVEESWDEIEVRAPVQLIAPSTEAAGVVVSGHTDPARLADPPTPAESRALARGAAVARTLIAAPEGTDLAARRATDLDPRLHPRWLAATTVMRSITAALADPAIEPGPIVVHGQQRGADAALLSAVNDPRVAGVATTGPAAIDLGVGRHGARAAGHLDHDIRALHRGLADNTDPAAVRRRGAAQLHMPVADEQATAAFIDQVLTGTAPDVRAPQLDATVDGSSVRVSVEFEPGSGVDETRLYWRIDNEPFDPADQLVMTRSGRAWRADITVDGDHRRVELITVHRIDSGDATSRFSAPYTRVEL